MKKHSGKALFFYIGSLACLAIFSAIVLKFGCHYYASITASLNSSTHSLSATDMIRHYMKQPLSIILFQIALILIVSKFFGYLFKLIGQPTVVGEIIAGITLGPSLFGWVFPTWSATLFAPKSLPTLQMLSQLGLILFIFVVGLELDLDKLKKQAMRAIVISHSSIFVSLIFGFALAIGLYKLYAPAGVGFLPFALFIGIALSITAFPVLVRIVRERGLDQHRIGTLIISCAAIDDISAWLMLSVAIAIVNAGSASAAWLSIALSITYVSAMLVVVRPTITKLFAKMNPNGELNHSSFSILLVIMITSSWITEVIGIHALFGAFLAGITCSGLVNIKDVLISKIEDLALLLLLPLFFAYSGLKTKLGLLSTSHDWAICAIVIAVAIAGKLIGSGLAAKAVGENWEDSGTIAILMNARGLVELVVLNIGYDLGVLSQSLFTILVLMALTTTFMTGPSLSAWQWAANQLRYRNKQI